MNPDMEHFFYDHPSPVAVSDLITTLASGVPLKVDRLPNSLLPHVVLLATIGLQNFKQLIVDDFNYLIQKTSDVWAEEDFTHRVFWHVELSIVSAITLRGAREVDLSVLPECGYMFRVYEQIVNAELEDLFGSNSSVKRKETR